MWQSEKRFLALFKIGLKTKTNFNFQKIFDRLLEKYLIFKTFSNALAIF